jgi:putative phosphoesterase
MRILVLSDIHGNAAALETVAREPHDAVLCLGDIVGYGPQPVECVDWVRHNATVVVQGNHDRAAGSVLRTGSRSDLEWLADATAPIAREDLSAEDIDYLHACPRWAVTELDGIRYLLVHATPRNPLYTYLGPDPVAWRDQLAGVEADVALVGHTHVQFALRATDDRLDIHVVNPGSVGQPRDGDPRAAYAVIDRGEVRLVRIDYPIERTVSALRSRGIERTAIDELAALLRTGLVPAVRDLPDAAVRPENGDAQTAADPNPSVGPRRVG